MIKIAVPGVSGRMGSAIAAHVLQSEGLKFVLATARPGNPMVGQTVANSDVRITSDFQGNEFDVLIDFTLPDGVMQHLAHCVANNVAMVIGSTGFSDLQIQAIYNASLTIPIVFDTNMSIGVNVCYKLLATAAQALGTDCNVSISDIHHKHKKDSPSGTAKKMAQIISTAADRPLDSISIDSKREGEIIGEHVVKFETDDEIISISHVAKNRDIYANGALAAARWVYNREPGLYSMQDVIA